MRTLCFILILAALITGSAQADFEAITIKNAGFARIVSGVENILKTTDFTIGDVKLLDQPTMEFMIELDYKGERVILVPTDFDIKAIDRFSKSKVDTMGVELRSHYDGVPLLIYVDYIRAPGVLYQQKSITIPPCRELKGAVLRRVTVESLRLKKNVDWLSAGSSGFGNDPKTAFAFADTKSNKGLCFDFPSGTVKAMINHSLNAYQEMEIPIEKGWRSAPFGLSAITGGPEAAFEAYCQFLTETRSPTLAKNPKLAALEKRFPECFGTYQYLPALAGGQVAAVGHIVDNKGFIFLFSSGEEDTKAMLPLAAAGLKLSGDLKLSDWTSLDKPTDIGTKTAADSVEVTIGEAGYSIVGVNVE